MSADTARLASQHHKLGKPGGPGLFHDKSLQLPAYIQNVAKALMRNGKPKSQAIQIAIGVVKNWAEGKGDVSPEVRAAAAKAVAEWEAAKAKARATPNKGADLSNPLDIASREKAADKGYALPDGSFPIRNVEELHKAIQAFGRAKDKDAAKRHIIKRAKALKATGALPDSWEVKLSNPFRRMLDFATGKAKQKKAAPAKGDEQSAKYGEPDLPKGATHWKHGWVPVNDQGKPVGPAQKPAWLIADEKKHAAAGGKTADQIRRKEGARALKAQHDRDAAPAKKAKAEAEAAAKKKAAAAKKAATAKATAAKKEETAKAKAAREKETLRKQAETAKQRQIQAAYKQALADQKAGRKLSPQQQRVVAYVQAQQKKQADANRKVDVPGQKVTTPKVAAKAPASASAKKTTATAKKPAPKVKVRSYKSASSRATALANVPWGVNVIDLAGGKNPAGHLAFRYKHNWILINPAIPSRGRMGGGLARKHGHISGTVTHGHFEDAGGGKKKFVPTRHGGVNSPAKLKAAHTKKEPAVVNGKVNYKKTPKQGDYTTAATMKPTKHDVLNPSTPSPEHVSSVSKAANEASTKANASKTVQDAQVAAKKHADAFVQAKKAGNNSLAESHKKNAQAWAKKAQQLKTAEKASADAKKKYEAEQKAKAASEKAAAEKAQAEQKAKVAAEHAKLKSDANAAYKKAFDMPEGSAHEKAQKAKAFDEAAKAHGAVLQHGGKHDLPEDKLVNAKLTQSQEMAAKLAKQAEEEKNAAHDAVTKSDAADAMTAKLAKKANPTAAEHKAAAKAHFDAGVAVSKLGTSKNLKAHHDKHLTEHLSKAEELENPAPSSSAGPGMQAAGKKMETTEAISSVLDEIEDEPGSLGQWDDYLHASAAAKADPTPANLKKLAAAQKTMKDAGVSQSGLTAANASLYKKLGLTKPAKKTVAKKAATAKKTAAKPPAAPVPDINLPGPGMYKDGLAIKNAQTKYDGMSAGPEKEALGKAIDNAKKKFQAKHGVAFKEEAAGKETGTTSTFMPPVIHDHITDHPFYSNAKSDGYEPVSNSVNANDGWKPSDVKGLKSSKGAYTYSGGSYTAINAHLRGNSNDGTPPGDPAEGAWAGTIKQMDKEFAAVPPSKKAIVTTRKMHDKGPFAAIPPYMEPGGVFQDLGYSSTAKDPAVWDGQVHMQVRIPAGTKYLDLNHTTGSQHPNEQEILLNRGTKYKVISDGPNPHSPGVRLIVVEVVP